MFVGPDGEESWYSVLMARTKAHTQYEETDFHVGYNGSKLVVVHPLLLEGVSLGYEHSTIPIGYEYRSRYLYLANALQLDADVLDCVKEISKEGREGIHIAREGDGVGLVFKMDSIESASRVKRNLAGRKFGENEDEVIFCGNQQSRCLYFATRQLSNLESDAEYDKFFEDMMEISEQDRENIHIPREGDGVGFVFIKMDSIKRACIVESKLRMCDVEVNYFSERAFEEGQFADPVPNTEPPNVRCFSEFDFRF